MIIRALGLGPGARGPGAARRGWAAGGIAVLSAAVLTLFFTVPAFGAIGAIGTAAGFEDNDANLAHGTLTDWNDFATGLNWNGTAPQQNAAITVNGWDFVGLTDWQKSTSDSGFAGGTKQDDACPKVIEASAPNKDDLKRIYVASKKVDGHIYLMLGWVRIPQNTTSSSAHVAFEFNQGTTSCGANSDGLVVRTAGDMLIVYDFEGGGTPVLSVRKWISSGTCEIGSDQPPCWGAATNLSSSGWAEAAVNTGGTATDALPPGGSETLGNSEFGEAGINLTDAGVFTSNACTSFGKVYAVSRSSGSSGTAQMKDLVGPGDVSITNCGRIVVKKVETGKTTGLTGATFKVEPGKLTTGTQAASSSLTDEGSGYYCVDNLPSGQTYKVTELTPPTGYTLPDPDNQSTTVNNNKTCAAENYSADVNLTFQDPPIRGAIKVFKTAKNHNATGGTAPLTGATFQLWDQNTPAKQVGTDQTTATDGDNATACFDNLPIGTYTVKESAAPTGYKKAASVNKTVTASGSCTSGYVEADVTDIPLSKIEVIFTSEAGSGVTVGEISCTGLVPDGTSTTSDKTYSDLVPNTYSCSVVVDP